jgi:hypothetical protein
MVLKSRRPSAGASRGSKIASFMGKVHYAGVPVTKKSPKRRRAIVVETIEARLERKANIADTKTFATDSLGQMTREKRHKLLYGD